MVLSNLSKILLEMNLFNNFILLRLIISTVCKLLTVVLCTYYIANAHSYNISWSLGNYFLSASTRESINEVLNSLGCYILAIPIAIIIVSWLMPESKVIQTLSSLIGVTGTLGFMINGIRYGTLTDYTNFRFIQIYNVVSLEEKTRIFTEAYLQLVSQVPSILHTKIEYLKIYLNENLHTMYVDNLKTMPVAQINDYAASVYDTACKLFETELKNSKKLTILSYIKDCTGRTTAIIKGVIVVAVILAVTGGVVLGYKYIQSVFNNHEDATKVLGEGVNSALTGVSKVGEAALTTTRITQELFERIAIIDTKVGLLTHNLVELTQTTIIKLEKKMTEKQ